MKKDVKSVWELIEQYIPNYSQCSRITELDELAKILDGQYEESIDDYAWVLLQEDYDGDARSDRIQSNHEELYEEILLETINNFLSSEDNTL